MAEKKITVDRHTLAGMWGEVTYAHGLMREEGIGSPEWMVWNSRRISAIRVIALMLVGPIDNSRPGQGRLAEAVELLSSLADGLKPLADVPSDLLMVYGK